MPTFMIEKTDSSEQTLSAAAYHEVDGYFHFLDELGDTVLTVCADSVAGIEQVQCRQATGNPPGEEEEPAASLEPGAALLIRYWSEPAHDAPLRMRITSTRSLRDDPTVIYAQDQDHVLSAVSTWLSMLTSAPDTCRSGRDHPETAD